MTARLLTTLAALAAASVCRAQAPAAAVAGPYGHLRIGVYMPKASDLDGFNNGLDVEGALGYRFHPNFAAEAGIGYYSSTTDTIQTLGASIKGTFSDLPITLSAKVILPAGIAEAYLLGGVGLHNVKLGAEASGAITSSISTTDTVFGYHLGGGFSIQVAPPLALSIDVRYLFGKAEFSFGGQSTSGDIDALFVTGGLQYRF